MSLNIYKEIQNEVNKDIRKKFFNIARGLLRRIKTVFAKEGARDGHPRWQPVSEIARANRKSKRRANPTLVDTGALRSSIQSEIIDVNNDIVVVIESDRNYAKDVQEGHFYVVGEKTYRVPAREFLFFTPSDAAFITKQLIHGK